MKIRKNVSLILKSLLLCIAVIVVGSFLFNLFPKYEEYQDKMPNFMKNKAPYIKEKIRLKDWHDKEQIQQDLIRAGPGEQGLSYILPIEYDAEKEKLYKLNGFNARCSDEISFNRSLVDIRHSKCKSKLYPSILPETSVIIPFFNEHWSTLLRTVWSVLNRSPKELLREIILVDDGSEKEFLKSQLDDYVKVHFVKVNVIHLSKRMGLIGARLAGAHKAEGDVLVFLDSHTECSINWLPPLLSPIVDDYKTCVCPFIDVIDYEDFAYRAQDEGARGSFDWNFDYKRLPLLREDKANMPEPFKSPVMAGGLFAISVKFFWELGGYDPGLQIWGGEQYELSFKIWQCGGQMVDAPCSRIGHIYRKFVPFGSGGVGDYLSRNYKRVAEVWMDEYAKYIYQRRTQTEMVNAGDISVQKEIRQRLKCRSFNWYLTNVAFDLMKVYPPIEPPDFAHGYIKNMGSGLCVDARYSGHMEVFGVERCGGGDQSFHLTWHRDIRPGKRPLCWDVSSSDSQATVLLYHCHGIGGNQLWRYDYKTHQLIHSNNQRCLEEKSSTKEIFASVCNSYKEEQKWLFEHFDSEKLDLWEQPQVLP